ncbi:piggyBac transposable element-derived protein 3-like [Homalodisca vitripennis]|uniref:piggyBac transposable element-derived protein 3-like n=1 Tax=Homalodisca vitripennis TaxID=197043 RepID=UPI001EEC26E3|nr:piggyBac transposable element-derived protein 3-like [Homalodisca vitripennis]
MPDFINVDRTPTEFFELFYDDQLIDLIVQELKNYAMFKGHHTFNVTSHEIRVFTGILLLSEYCSVARNRLYWDTGADTHHPGVAAAMSRTRFEEILRYFHVADNNNLDVTDKYTKIRPLWKYLKEKWLEYFPRDANVSIDESMVRYFGRHGAKQHIHNKPIRFGFKVWSMCTRLGYIIQGEPYQGASTGNTHPHLGCGGSVVMNLVKRLPSDSKYSLFVDNYFTSLPLLEELKENGHDCTDTIRVDRIEKAPLTDHKLFKKLKRGSFEQLSDRKSGTTLVRSNDNSVVTLASNRAGVSPMGSCNRWSQQEKRRISVKRPLCVGLYNLYMGGVDRLDQNVLAYKPTIRMKKWYWQLNLFPLSCSMNNAFQLYKLSPAGKSKDAFDFLGFIREVVQVYLRRNVDRPSIGRPSKKSRIRVPDGLCLDGIGHLIVSNTTRIRCAECHKNTPRNVRNVQ